MFDYEIHQAQAFKARQARARREAAFVEHLGLELPEKYGDGFDARQWAQLAEMDARYGM